MNSAFKERIDRMKLLYQDLMQCPLHISKDATRKSLVPAKGGVYVFYEHCIPLYVGRSNNLKQRMVLHRQKNPSGATFAFRLAMIEAVNIGIDLNKFNSRSDRLCDPEIVNLFDSARDRIANMSVRWVAVEDSITQAIFEMYAHLELNTPHNDFNNH